MSTSGRPEEQPGGEESLDTVGETGSPAAKPRQAKRTIAIVAAAAAVVVAGGAYALSQVGDSTPANHIQAASAQLPSGPIQLESTSPATGATQVNGANPLILSFSQPVAPNSPVPTLQPAIPGNWTAMGNDFIFSPTTAFGPSSHITVSIPAGPNGVRGAGGGLLTQPATLHFTTGTYSELRLAQLLGQLGYLPMTWSSAEGGAANERLTSANTASGSQQAEAYDPPSGNFVWLSGYPATLRSMWTTNGQNVILRGAVMAFESQHGLPITGVINQRLWTEVFKAAAHGEQNGNGYTYAIANKGSPETLTIWHDGHQVLHSLANTGIPSAPTVDGTFPVYLRFLHTIMSGTNPDGSHYSDPVSYVSYFNGGDAVHYFVRPGYGYEQSLGCVELPFNSAVRAYPFLTYGSLVTVNG